MAQELTHTIRSSKNKKHGMAVIKIDMSKAFDRVSWVFLFNLLGNLNFPPHWIQLVKECVTTVQYYVIVNGQTSDTFFPKCGLRQGDILSPILFALYSEALSSTFLHLQEIKDIKGVSIVKNDPLISHLLFADDNYFFIHLDNKTICALSSAISTFCKDSGQIINYHKSIITFSPNTPAHIKIVSLSSLGISSSDTFGSYLGVPLDITTNRK
ncbi:hypothetical protein LIER_24903 [Lithospermum erythrorhizon]|uniref:Reverse transcriptase domain-containing protein n=1 Tax=Lithospermum erythrorhizon TaxID=34254 RepID=A0AAV3R5V7_LITER